jgi:cytochrome P450
LQPDDCVVVLQGAANRDPREFPDPDVVDLCRTGASAPLAFSAGIHYCLGAPLARLQGTVFLERLGERVRAIEPAADFRWRPQLTSRALEQCRVRLTPR